MNLPYLTIPFSFSPEALAFIKERTDPMVEEYQKNAPLDAALIDTKRENIQDWYDSIVYKEIKEQLAPVGIDEEPLIQFFIYKKLNKPRQDVRGNPHVDTYNGVEAVVPIRFNILVSGGEYEEMVWWDISDWENDSRLTVSEYPRPNDPTKFNKRVQATGESIPDRWKSVGEPMYRFNKLTKVNQYASFVRTDVLHALNWAGYQPRLILSLRFLTSWDKIEEFRARVQQKPVPLEDFLSTQSS
jgi:hypothetical protein